MSPNLELRIFLTSSQLSTAFYSAYAQKTKDENLYYDVLVIDRTPKKVSLVKNILERAAIFHSWNEVLDLSIALEDSQSTRPSFKKRMTRKFKSLPIIKGFYDSLLKRYLKKQKSEYKFLFQEKIKVQAEFQKVSLHVLTQTILNETLFEIYPNAEVHYFEHGTGDYFYVLKPDLKLNQFHCFFTEAFSNYLKSLSIGIPLSSYLEKTDFEKIFTLDFQDPLCHDLNLKISNTKLDVHLILLDAFEIYHPPVKFWTDYLDRIVSQTSSLNNILFVLKPHPNQSKESIAISVNYFKERELQFLLFEGAELSQLSVETFFVSHQAKIKSVYSTFSSALFYLSHFYSDKTKFYMLYDFASSYINSAPKQYKEIFKGLRPLIDEVFDPNRKINRL